MEEFVGACQATLTNSSWGEYRGLVEVVMSMAEYSYFIAMMASTAAEQQDKAGGGGTDGGVDDVDDVDGFM